jgi:SpoVK/Ycf46/Vps4 family AAA+-type ATPase
MYGNLSARSIEQQMFKPPIIVDSDGSDIMDPYEKILSPHHRMNLKTEITSGSPVQMLTRRQRKLLGAGLEQPENESTPLKGFGQDQDEDPIKRTAIDGISSRVRLRSRRLASENRTDDNPPEGQEHDAEMEVTNEQGTPLENGEKEADKGDEEAEISDLESEEGEEEEGEEEEEAGRSYNFRKRRPVTYQDQYLLRYVQQGDAQHHKRQSRHRNYTQAHHRSPAYNRRTRFPTRRRHTAHRSSSSTSSSGEDSDEKHFQRRKSRSMNKARQRCLPMNITNTDMNLASFGTARDRQRVGASLADVDPMNVDKSVTFASIGGLQEHVKSLKEMVVFPLLYPEVFQRFSIAPPRGVLFHGAPGCGKTLVARALANECSKGERKVAFFMRKGADCLSKWVGESERQLRLLFDQAYQMRPAIIFFDEIDGLAPVRSSKQDQIHSSIVSTLLALMDGLDNRGEIVVIGATNRIDAIDPAFRRPGRFDRELFFPLPAFQDRTKILQIHTSDWKPRLKQSFLAELAELTVGYCGADLKALCAESALVALRRIYPQIYASSEKLVINPERILVQPRDFLQAMEKITPASQRVELSPACPLSPAIHCLLSRHMKQLITVLEFVFPAAWKQLQKVARVYCKVDDRCVGEHVSTSFIVGSPMEATDSHNSEPVVSGNGRAGSKDTYPIVRSGRVHRISTSSKFGCVQTAPNTSAFSMEKILSSRSSEETVSSVSKKSSCPSLHADHHTCTSERISVLPRPVPLDSMNVSSTTPYQNYNKFYRQLSAENTGTMYFEVGNSASHTHFANVNIYESDEEDGQKERTNTGIAEKQMQEVQTAPFGHLFSKRILSSQGVDPHRCPSLFRSRLLICGQVHMGQTQHLGPALLHALEGFTQHVLDLSVLYSVAMRTPEEACHQVLREARRTAPSIVYLPNMEMWWDSAGDTLKSIFSSAVSSVAHSKPLLLLATYEGFVDESSSCIPELFDLTQGEVVMVTPPRQQERREYFQDVMLVQMSLPPLEPPQPVEELMVEELPKAAPPPPQELTEVEKKKLIVRREATLRELRVFLRDSTNKLMAERKFKEFTKPVDPDEVYDYYDVIHNPMDLSTVMKKIDERCYQTAKEWLQDIDLITRNALEYNPETSNESRLLRHRACELQDMAHSVMDHELSEDFEKLCHDLKESAQRVGIQSPVFHQPRIPHRSTSRQPKHHSRDDFNNLSDDEEMSMYRRRSLRQQGVEPQVEGIPYYGPRRLRKRAQIDEDEDDDEEMSGSVWKSDESRHGSSRDKEETAQGKWGTDNEMDAISVGEEDECEDRATADGHSVLEREKDGMEEEKHQDLNHSPTECEKLDETRDDDDPPSSDGELIVDVTTESVLAANEKVVPNGKRENDVSRTHSRLLGNQNDDSDISNNTPEKLLVKYPKSAITIAKHTDGDGNSPSEGSHGNILSPSTVDQSDSNCDNRVSEIRSKKGSSPLVAANSSLNPREVVIDRTRQLAVLEALVERTEGCNLEVLQKLHSMLEHLVFRHRMREDKSQLLNEMELLLATFFKR